MIRNAVPLALLGLTGCLSSPQTSTNENELQASERAAIDAAVETIESLTVAGNSVQGSTSIPLDSQTAREKEMPTLGSCPAVSVDASKLTNLTLQMTLDYGSQGCTPFEGDHMVSGSATGTLRLLEQNLVVTFHDLESDSRSLQGGLEVDFARSDNELALDGTWELATSSVASAGTGIVAFDAETGATTIRNYAGTATTDEGDWSLTTDSLMLAPVTHENFIPFDGALQLSAVPTRVISVTFDQDSPSTGLVTVQINDGPTQEVSLFQL